MDPADRYPGPWTSQTEFGGFCMWAEVGVVNYTVKTDPPNERTAAEFEVDVYWAR